MRVGASCRKKRSLRKSTRPKSCVRDSKFSKDAPPPWQPTHADGKEAASGAEGRARLWHELPRVAEEKTRVRRGKVHDIVVGQAHTQGQQLVDPCVRQLYRRVLPWKGKKGSALDKKKKNRVPCKERRVGKTPWREAGEPEGGRRRGRGRRGGAPSQGPHPRRGGREWWPR